MNGSGIFKGGDKMGKVIEKVIPNPKSPEMPMVEILSAIIRNGLGKRN